MVKDYLLKDSGPYTFISIPIKFEIFTVSNVETITCRILDAWSRKVRSVRLTEVE